jgi:S-adenosylmethionine:tRNA ribosyltransferase-isomerase
MLENWRLDDFDYNLPPELIAQHPLAERSMSRLMVLSPESDSIKHAYFNEFSNFLNKEDLLVFNNNKVIPARLIGHKASGGRVECLVERILDEQSLLAHVRASKPLQKGHEIIINPSFTLTVIDRQDDLFRLEVSGQESIFSLLDQFGQVPLPPYMTRSPEENDRDRYQTIFAKHPGAIAAPTAALHFDDHMINILEKKKISFATLTLHVGSGTFRPVRVQNILDHPMHTEYLEVSPELCEAVYQCQERGGRVIAVGTTVVRGLETATQSGKLLPFTGETQIFIYPGFRFQCVNALLTNFHMPKSSLLMLVCAFGGYEYVMKAYREAVIQRYRFFSYGDAMFLSGVADKERL